MTTERSDGRTAPASEGGPLQRQERWHERQRYIKGMQVSATCTGTVQYAHAPEFWGSCEGGAAIVLRVNPSELTVDGAAPRVEFSRWVDANQAEKLTAVDGVEVEVEAAVPKDWKSCRSVV